MSVQPSFCVGSGRKPHRFSQKAHIAPFDVGSSQFWLKIHVSQILHKIYERSVCDKTLSLGDNGQYVTKH